MKVTSRLLSFGNVKPNFLFATSQRCVSSGLLNQRQSKLVAGKRMTMYFGQQKYKKFEGLSENKKDSKNDLLTQSRNEMRIYSIPNRWSTCSSFRSSLSSSIMASHSFQRSSRKIYSRKIYSASESNSSNDNKESEQLSENDSLENDLEFESDIRHLNDPKYILSGNKAFMNGEVMENFKKSHVEFLRLGNAEALENEIESLFTKYASEVSLFFLSFCYNDLIVLYSRKERPNDVLRILNKCYILQMDLNPPAIFSSLTCFVNGGPAFQGDIRYLREVMKKKNILETSDLLVKLIFYYGDLKDYKEMRFCLAFLMRKNNYTISQLEWIEWLSLAEGCTETHSFVCNRNFSYIREMREKERTKFFSITSSLHFSEVLYSLCSNKHYNRAMILIEMLIKYKEGLNLHFIESTLNGTLESEGIHSFQKMISYFESLDQKRSIILTCDKTVKQVSLYSSQKVVEYIIRYYALLGQYENIQNFINKRTKAVEYTPSILCSYIIAFGKRSEPQKLKPLLEFARKQEVTINNEIFDSLLSIYMKSEASFSFEVDALFEEIIKSKEKISSETYFKLLQYYGKIVKDFDTIALIYSKLTETNEHMIKTDVFSCLLEIYMEGGNEEGMQWVFSEMERLNVIVNEEFFENILEQFSENFSRDDKTKEKMRTIVLSEVLKRPTRSQKLYEKMIEHFTDIGMYEKVSLVFQEALVWKRKLKKSRKFDFKNLMIRKFLLASEHLNYSHTLNQFLDVVLLGENNNLGNNQLGFSFESEELNLLIRAYKKKEFVNIDSLLKLIEIMDPQFKFSIENVDTFFSSDGSDSSKSKFVLTTVSIDELLDLFGSLYGNLVSNKHSVRMMQKVLIIVLRKRVSMNKGEHFSQRTILLFLKAFNNFKLPWKYYELLFELTKYDTSKFGEPEYIELISEAVRSSNTDRMMKIEKEVETKTFYPKVRENIFMFWLENSLKIKNMEKFEIYFQKYEPFISDEVWLLKIKMQAAVISRNMASFFEEYVKLKDIYGNNLQNSGLYQFTISQLITAKEYDEALVIMDEAKELYQDILPETMAVLTLHAIQVDKCDVVKKLLADMRLQGKLSKDKRFWSRLIRYFNKKDDFSLMKSIQLDMDMLGIPLMKFEKSILKSAEQRFIEKRKEKNEFEDV